MAVHHLAQVNVATLRAPLDGPELAGFVAQLEPINALADHSPGFVWRLQLDVMRRRREWFHRMADPYLALWWVPAGTIPTVAEARDRLELLAGKGPTADAFTFRAPFPEPADATR
jgi:hypothetical protein